MPHAFYIVFLFVVGACVGSFLNVVVYRLPRGQSLAHPPSRCPKCEHPLAWYDNIPVFGWLMLRGKCRYCGNPISPRYPIVEGVTGSLFALFYIAIYLGHQGPFWVSFDEAGVLAELYRMENLAADWPIFSLYLFTIACLLAASLIDAELYLIPPSITWLLAGAALLVHGFVDRESVPGSLTATAPQMALAAGAGIGLVISIILLRLGVIPLSFASGGPPLEVDKLNSPDEELPDFTPAEVRKEISKEILFLLPPLILGGVAFAFHGWFESLAQIDWLSGLLGSLLGGLVGGGIVWITRIIFSLVFGREAMGLGDIDLMFAVGAVIGPGAAVVAFFLAPLFGLPLALGMLMFKSRRQIPYGPYLSMATVAVMLFYFPIYIYLRPGLIGLGTLLRSLF